jgi:hypothetical protein
MQKMGKSLGMEIGTPLPPHSMREPTRDTRELESFFHSVKSKKVELVVVVVPDKGNCYGKMFSFLIKYSCTLAKFEVLTLVLLKIQVSWDSYLVN